MKITRITIDLDKVEFASFPKRIGARLLDSFIVGILLFVFLDLSNMNIDFQKNISSKDLLTISLYAIAFSLAYEVPILASRGLTIGKRAFGICVVRTDGQIGIGLDRALTRAIVPQA